MELHIDATCRKVALRRIAQLAQALKRCTRHRGVADGSHYHKAFHAHMLQGGAMRKHIDKIFVGHALLVRLAVVDFNKHVLHNARRGSQSIDFIGVAFLVQRMDEACAPHYLVELARLDIANKMPVLARERVVLANEFIGAVFPEIVNARLNCLGNRIKPHGLRHANDTHIASGATRSRFAPNVPTFAEQGYKDLVFSEWFGFFAPGGTQAPVVNRANEALRAALAQKDVIDGLAVMGLEVKSSTPQELGALLKESYDRWGPIVKKIGFTADS